MQFGKLAGEMIELATSEHRGPFSLLGHKTKNDYDDIAQITTKNLLNF